MAEGKSSFVYVTYIRTTPEKLWSALTGAEFQKQYWFGMHCECEWKPGAPWKLVSPDGVIYDAGEIVETAPGNPLAAPEQARAQGRRAVAVHDRTGTHRRRGQAFHRPHHRARRFEIGRGRVGRLAEGHFQLEVHAGDRLRSDDGPVPKLAVT
jgi:uncharacterized protein YndB with AHSA1/START domain